MYNFSRIRIQLCPIAIRTWNRIETESGSGSVSFLLALLAAAAAADDEAFLELLFDERLALRDRKEKRLPALIAHGFVEAGFVHRKGMERTTDIPFEQRPVRARSRQHLAGTGRLRLTL